MTDRPGVLTLGETMVSLRSSGPLRVDGRMRVSVAGAESNVAIGLARLGHPVRWAGVVGADPFGDLIVRSLRGEGVETCVRVDPEAPTGLIFFEERLADVTRVQYRRAGSAGSRLEPADVDAAWDGWTPAAVHLTGVTPALGSGPCRAVLHALQRGREAGALCFFTVNHRANLWSRDAARPVIADAARLADVVVAAAGELALTVPDDGGPVSVEEGSGPTEEELAGRLLDLGVSEVLVTAGSAGATLYCGDGVRHQPAPPVRAVDSVGAGDAFVAGFLSGHLDGLGPDERLRRAAITAGFAVATVGDWEGLPTRAELPLLGLDPGATLR